MSMITLTTDSLSLAFDRDTGALCRLDATETAWHILRRPALGLSWRLLVPIGEELRNNPVYGEKQAVTSLTQGEGWVEFRWEKIVSERAGVLDITVTTRIAIEERQAVWYTRIDNQSPYVVESVHSPYLGDLSRPEGAAWFRTFLYSYASANEWSLWPRFENHPGYFGVDFPTQHGHHANCGAPMSPYFLLRSESQGLYMGIKEPSEALVTWNCELRPGYGSALDARVPDTDEIAGKPVHIRAAAIHMPYLQPGASLSLTPVALEAYLGGWQEGSDIYKAWRDSWSSSAKVPAWAREPHAWLQLHINSPEDELRLRYVDLPKVARECADAGVSVIQLVGWNNGGQDQGNPSHSHDPRLGSHQELKQAIAECQAMGVRIVLFAKFTWADRGTDWFRQELIDYAIKDPYGDYYMHGGYRYQTPAQLLDINTKRLVPMCFASDAYMDHCRREFAKLVDLGCDGFLFDECFHHSPALLCFDMSHGHRYGWPVYSNDRKFVYALQETPGLAEDFLFSGEALYDWEFEAYALSYHRSEGKRHLPLSRYLRPQAQLMTAVTGFADRDMLNQCLMYRYIISYEPYNFKGWLHDFPDTVAYGQQVDALRGAHRAYFWDGEYQDTCGATCTLPDGTPHHPYAVFQAADGTKAMVVCNYEDSAVMVQARIEGQALARYRTVDSDSWHAPCAGIQIPPHSAVIILPAE